MIWRQDTISRRFPCCFELHNIVCQGLQTLEAAFSGMANVKLLLSLKLISTSSRRHVATCSLITLFLRTELKEKADSVKSIINAKELNSLRRKMFEFILEFSYWNNFMHIPSSKIATLSIMHTLTDIGFINESILGILYFRHSFNYSLSWKEQQFLDNIILSIV